MSDHHQQHPDHVAHVDAWMAHVPTHPPEEVITALEESVNTMWRRSEVTLGTLTLGAVVDRVLHDTTIRYPAFAQVGLDGRTGIEVDGLLEHADTVDAQQLHEGMRFMLTELLDVVGALTADVLTPALHAAIPERLAARGICR